MTEVEEALYVIRSNELSAQRSAGKRAHDSMQAISALAAAAMTAFEDLEDDYPHVAAELLRFFDKHIRREQDSCESDINDILFPLR